MQTMSMDIDYDVIDKAVNVLKEILEDSYVVSEDGITGVDNIDATDIFADSTGDSAKEMADAFNNVKHAYELINTLVATSMNMLNNVKDTYMEIDRIMEEYILPDDGITECC